jgi:lincosamide nucleotidyltransferase A/C/D/E
MYIAEYSASHRRTDMSGDVAVYLLQLFAQHDITVVVDGGWGVDALLGKQTRPHNDLDIALAQTDTPQLRALLATHGYQDVWRADSWECNFVLGDSLGHEVDVHSYLYDAQGNLISGVAYPRASLTGCGSIQGYPVRCIDPAWQVQFHTGYKLDENDYRDVLALCEHFGLALPADYEHFPR